MNLPKPSSPAYLVRHIKADDGAASGYEIYVRPFPATRGGRWQISAGGGVYAFWSNNGRELFYETAYHQIMVVGYTVSGDSFLPSKPRLWSDRQLFSAATSNLDLAPDGKRFVVLTLPEPAPGEKGSVHVTMLLNFFDEVRRRIPVSKIKPGRRYRTLALSVGPAARNHDLRHP